ncbi:acetyltransferase [Liquorilactobacillus ghanensis DSM 18630]|uniref:Acetyltransferase n=1 Tax=Liquorilactobacillus ghanensis DSM 18630 TaxID=1423750 RepID=A0A0R1VJ50_9LACO|nr:GNAT family protein [Liquorilactobacillus ghanensis]KRM05277.1 acetyltransferase [Liquorilactobacillus ghanensis DSM 18630]
MGEGNLTQINKLKIELRQLKQAELAKFWQLAFSDTEAEWINWNGPYFAESLPNKLEFIQGISSKDYLINPFKKIIWVDNQMVGMVSARYVDGDLKRWLEIGICLYQSATWRQHIGYYSLKLWLDQLFRETDLPHIGLTTWSGNYRMLGLAEKLGMKKEAQVRQVRYWQNQYWDSVKYGILRTEWQQIKDK